VITRLRFFLIGAFLGVIGPLLPGGSATPVPVVPP